MPRRPRIHLADHPQHIVQRGHNRAACFLPKRGYRFTLHGLKPGAEQYGGAVHARVLMTNPVHRLLTPDARSGIAQVPQSPRRRDARHVSRCCKRSDSGRVISLPGAWAD